VGSAQAEKEKTWHALDLHAIKYDCAKLLRVQLPRRTPRQAMVLNRGYPVVSRYKQRETSIFEFHIGIIRAEQCIVRNVEMHQLENCTKYFSHL